jgi:hypothetical protein
MVGWYGARRIPAAPSPKRTVLGTSKPYIGRQARAHSLTARPGVCVGVPDLPMCHAVETGERRSH